MTIIEYAEKMGVFKYLSNSMIDILEEAQKAIENGESLLEYHGLRNGRTLLRAIILKYEGYLEGCKEVRADAIDEFVAFANTLPTVEDEDGYIRPMRLEEMAEKLKEEKENEKR